jgi:hypothetical protein
MEVSMSMLFDGPIWGVDSYAPANIPGSNCLYDRVAKRKKPAFWGRYIRCPNLSDGNVLNEVEKDYLFKKGCAILPIYNRTVYQRRGLSWSGTFADGVTDAVDAIAAAINLQIPAGVWLYADLEPSWPNVSTNWILGWWCTIYPSPYWPGLYCTLRDKYCSALTQVQSLQPPPNMSFIDLLRWRTIPDIRWASNVWSFSPHRGSFDTPPSWEPLAPPCHAEGVRIWQYCGNEIIGGTYVDADIATVDAFNGMWQPPTPLWQA